MSPDEVFVSLVSAAVATVFVLGNAVRAAPLRAPGGAKLVVALAPLVASLVILGLLRAFAASDVRSDGRYLAMYSVMGLAWISLCGVVFRLFGLDVSRDWLERRNGASGVLWLGGLLGASLAFAGGNFGDGPGWWVVVYSSGLATITLLGLWFVVDRFVDVTAQVSIDRSTAVAVRFATFLVVAGAIVGRGAAGTWISVGAATSDFVAISWPLLVLATLETLLGRMTRPTAEAPHPSLVGAGLLPASFYVAAGALVLAWVGPWA